MKLLKNLFDGIVNGFAVLAGVILVLVMLSVCLDVVMRYFLKLPMVWVDELAEYALLFITFLGTTWVLKQPDGHVIVDVVGSLLSPEKRNILTIISSIVGIFTCAIVTYFGVKVTWGLFARGIYNPTTLEIPRGILVAVIPAGSFLLCMQFIDRLAQALTKIPKRR